MSIKIGLDDLEDFVISPKRRKKGDLRNIINEYSLDSLIEMKEINCNEIFNLINTIENLAQQIEDDKLRQRILNWKKIYLETTLKINQEFNPNEFYKKNVACDFLQKCEKICSFGGIAEFLNRIFYSKKICDKKGLYDGIILDSMFKETKKACSNLGIASPRESELYDAYMDPEGDTTHSIGIRPEIFNDNSLEDDGIEIMSIPYHICCPKFDSRGKISGYIHLHITDGICRYNVEKYDELVERAKQNEYENR